jgi:hypothetical protein
MGIEIQPFAGMTERISSFGSVRWAAGNSVQRNFDTHQLEIIMLAIVSRQ